MPEGNHMNKMIAMLLGGAAALSLTGQSQAAPAAPQAAQAESPQSYAELLAPIPDAVAALKADDERLAQQGGEATVQLARYYHHHHHHWYRGYYGGPYYGGYAYGPGYGGCYWTWGRAYWNGWRWIRPRVRVCG